MHLIATVKLTQAEAADLAREVLIKRLGSNDVTVTVGEELDRFHHPNFKPFSLNEPVPQICIGLIMAGEKIGAIKEARAFFGWGLKEAKDYIEHVANRYNDFRRS